MTVDDTKKYLALAVATKYDVDKHGADAVPVSVMRRIVKLLILHGTCPNCAICNQLITTVDDLSFDHIVPRACGGSNRLHNMQLTHRECNMGKGTDFTDADVTISCMNTDDNPTEISKRKQARKNSEQKNRKVLRIKPWEIDDDFTR